MPEFLIVLLVIALMVGVAAALVTTLRRRGLPPHEAPAPEAERAEAPAVEAPPEVVEAPPAEVVEAPAGEVFERPSLRERLRKSRRFLADRLADAFGAGADEETWEDVESVLIQADLGVESAARAIEHLRERSRSERVSSPQEIRELLAGELFARFDTGRERALTYAPEGTTVWIVAGVNGTGKTTTIGKIAADLKSHGRSVAMAAADTFRAAADEQLGIWADRSGAHIVKHQPGADPGAVAYDAYAFSRARSIDVLIVDTAGRLHTKTPLMDELAKVRRVIEKEGHVQEALLVIDATAGQNGLAQARQFTESLGVTGIVLTKLDGTAKGGIALAIEETLGIPIKLIGVGEGIEDLEPFDPKAFVDALLS